MIPKKNRSTHRRPRVATHDANYEVKAAQKRSGKVFLVGAGPGDPGLLTLRGYEALRQADVVLYDALVHSVVVDYAERAEKVFVGKLPQSRLVSGASHQPAKHCKAPDQDEINRQLVEYARQGKRVVRLKGGDPFVFGRGGEEAEYLRKHDISFEIISGVSAGFAAPAFAGIPVTDRRFTSAVVFVTAHENPEKQNVSVDWKKLAQLQATLVCFMGVKSLPEVARQLVQGGKPSSTPVCVIEWGTLARQRVVEGTLQNIALRAQAEKIESPALTVIGEVVSLRKTLDWFGRKPLIGKRILITRATADAGPFRSMLEAEGAVVCEAPMIKIEPARNADPLDREIKERMSRFGWILFTSVHAVEHFFSRLKSLGLDSRALGKSKIAAVGDKTTEALRSYGLEPDLVPRAFHSRELLRELQEKYFVRGQKFLWPRADIAPLDLKTELEQAGAEVTDIVLYHTVADPEGRQRVAEILSAGPLDYAVFTSGSGVKNFFKGVGAEEIQQIKDKVVSIGPQTSQALREFKVSILAEAKQHNLDGLLQTLQDLSAGSPVLSGKVSEPLKRGAVQPQRSAAKQDFKKKPAESPTASKSPLASRVQEAKTRIQSHAPRTAASKVQRFAPRPRRAK